MQRHHRHHTATRTPHRAAKPQTSGGQLIQQGSWRTAASGQFIELTIRSMDAVDSNQMTVYCSLLALQRNTLHLFRPEDITCGDNSFDVHYFTEQYQRK